MIFGAGPVPFLACLGLGAGLGLTYIVIGFGINKLKLNKILINVLSFLFVILTAFLYFLVCFFTLEGNFRLFTLVGLGIGVGISFVIARLLKNLFKRASDKRKKLSCKSK